MMRRALLGVVCLLIAGICVAKAQGVTALTETDAAQWKQWLCPLPKQVELTGKATVPLERLRVRVAEDAGAVDGQLAAELAAALEAKSGVEADLAAAAGEGDVVLDFRRRDEDRALLADLPHSDQAYCLESVMQGQSVSLACRALSESGSAFGMRTLVQLLAASVQGAGQAATVDLPVGRILD